MTWTPRMSCPKRASSTIVHSHGMRLVRNAFGHVRSRWRLLDECWKGECQEALPYVVVAGCLLHNFLIKCGEPDPEEIQEGAAAELFSDFEGEKDRKERGSGMFSPCT
ncbi:hypothetical protein OsI_17652 [Oryza sativa Indica Group]|uniref:DDE Tnp4 domain-containing protein n=1 Tax=Oryza sativa subsp. indica TaxID=39946 RepID=B8AV84_ORYSI|nr:hypothetical protein OsI_17652 [Oryza sativa Indica Group]